MFVNTYKIERELKRALCFNNIDITTMSIPKETHLVVHSRLAITLPELSLEYLPITNRGELIICYDPRY